MRLPLVTLGDSDVTATQEALKVVATLACSLFAGAALYINVVEHPARMSCGTHVAATQWAPSYQRATWLQAPLAIVGLLSGTIAWLLGSSLSWLVGALLLGSVVPLTLIVIKPTNTLLLSSTLDRGSQQAHELLSKWNRLHAVRTVLSLISLAVFLISLRS
jgi:uncharacterized membrane protein